MGFMQNKISSVIGILGAMALLVISPLPAHAQTETTLYNFGSMPDGNYPRGSLIRWSTNFYGTTYQGGVNGLGAVYSD
jgi:hypothetical protein